MSGTLNRTTPPSPAATVTATTGLPVCRDADSLHRLQLAWNSVVLAAALPLNAMALWVFVGPLRLRTVPSVYMANLAACDLLFALALPLRLLHSAAGGRWPLGDAPCRLAGCLFQLNMYGSCLFLAALNVDRYLALVRPLRSRRLRRRPVAWRVCGAAWALMAVGSVPVAMAHGTSGCRGANASRQLRCFEGFSDGDWRVELLPLVVAAELLGFVLPLAAVLYCSAQILGTLGPIGPAGPANPEVREEAEEGRRRRRRRRRKTVLLLLVNALIFVACFGPYNVALAVYALARSDLLVLGQSSEEGLRQALQVAILLSASNCCLDPLVYYYSTEGFRHTFWGWRRRGGGRRGTEMGTGRGTTLASRSYFRAPTQAQGESMV
ncbi:lysophosphatidic acid receptor 5-like [Pristis pectinata]|uniref:lysophosphatidic acid receptor 5-like n=1 Tax=Pristis pectinata TaxID=685728 RepID=UPI00223D055E|nr:lysophosphatidic acid receptor 5-like [Pristis pectinata]